MKPYIVGVAGGSASGKTEIVKTLKKHFEDKIEIIEHDNYYFAHDNLTMDERASLNYDHPQAFETDLLIMKKSTFQLTILQFTQEALILWRKVQSQLWL